MHGDDSAYGQFYDGKKMGLKAIGGVVAVPAVYDFVGMPSEGLCAVSLNGSWGYANVEGKEVIRPRSSFTAAREFSHGLAAVRVGELYGYVNRLGFFDIQPRFAFAESFSEGLAVVRAEGGLSGAIDRSGSFVVAPKYRWLGSFEGGYARFCESEGMNLFGLLDQRGTETTPARFTSIQNVRIGTARVVERIRDESVPGYRVGESRSGLLNIATGQVAWNDEMRHANARDRAIKEAHEEFTGLIKDCYAKGCACHRARLVDYVTWPSLPVRWIDREVLWSAWRPYLESELAHEDDARGNIQRFLCPNCSSRYTQRFDEYSISLQIVHVESELNEALQSIGAAPEAVLPTALGLQGHQLEEVKGTYYHATVAELVAYLRV